MSIWRSVQLQGRETEDDDKNAEDRRYGQKVSKITAEGDFCNIAQRIQPREFFEKKELAAKHRKQCLFLFQDHAGRFTAVENRQQCSGCNERPFSRARRHECGAYRNVWE